MIINYSKFNNHWETKTLNDLGTFRRGKSKHRPRNDSALFENGEYPLIQTGEIKDANLYINSHKGSYNEFGLKQSKLWNKGTLCITIAANIAETAILNYPMCFPDSVVGFNAFKDKSSEIFIHYVITYIRKAIQNAASGSIQDNINIDYLTSLKFKIPTKQIQDKIAAVLSALDDKIELNNQINTELEAMAKTLYDYWFVQFDFPDENGKPYQSSGGKMVFNDILKREIPVGWEVKSFDGLIDFTRGVSYTSATMNESVGIPMINLKSFNLNGTYRIDGLKYFTGKLNENRIISKSDLLIAITDVTRDAEIIGKAILVPEFSENAVCSCDVSRVDILNESFSKNYLRYLFNSSYYHNYIKHYASGTLVLHLDLKGILWYTDVIPPKELQLKFDHFVNKIDAKIQTNLQQNKELAQLRDWLLPMLMNGQVRVGSGEYEMEEGGLGMVGEGKREYKKI